MISNGQATASQTRRLAAFFHGWTFCDVYLCLQGDLTAGYTSCAGRPQHPPDLPCLPFSNEEDVGEEEEGKIVPLPTEDILSCYLDTLTPAYKTKHIKVKKRAQKIQIGFQL